MTAWLSTSTRTAGRTSTTLAIRRQASCSATNHDGTFTEEGIERGIALNDDGMEQAGMGIGVGDINLDGRLDIFKTHSLMIRMCSISTKGRAPSAT